VSLFEHRIGRVRAAAGCSMLLAHRLKAGAHRRHRDAGIAHWSANDSLSSAG